MAGLKRTVVTDQEKASSAAGSEGKYLDAVSTAADFTGATIDCKGLDKLSFTLSFEASLARDLDIKIQGSNDPTAWSSPSTAKWTDYTWPSGAVSGDLTVSGEDATMGAGEGDAIITVKDLPRFVRLRGASQTAGAAATVTAWVFGQ